MDIARLNMSHGSHAEHEQRYHDVRQAAKVFGRSLGVLADLQGPKIRLGKFADGPVELEPGAQFTITTDAVAGNAQRCSTTYAGLPGDVREGDRVLIDDGRLALQVEEVRGSDVVTRVIQGGPVSDNKGINLPGIVVSVPALSDKDADDLRWALRIGVDIVALSFVQSPDDIRRVHAIMDEVGVRVPVIAKLEKPQAVENLEAVVDAFDGVMVARGDLGVELPLWDVPLVQKRAIELARRRAKPVIVATQMLESMIENPRPTRAEASDVANAVLDGADAVMLSGETSVGAYPVEAVATMARIVETVEVQGFRPDTAARGPTEVPGRRDDLGCRRNRRHAGRAVPGRLHPERRLGTTHVAASVVDTVAWLHPAGVHAQPAGPVLGRGAVPRSTRQPHRRDGAAGRPDAGGYEPLPPRRHGGGGRRLAARYAGLDEHRADPSHRRGCREPAGFQLITPVPWVGVEPTDTAF